MHVMWTDARRKQKEYPKVFKLSFVFNFRAHQHRCIHAHSLSLHYTVCRECDITWCWKFCYIVFFVVVRFPPTQVRDKERENAWDWNLNGIGRMNDHQHFAVQCEIINKVQLKWNWVYCWKQTGNCNCNENGKRNRNIAYLILHVIIVGATTKTAAASTTTKTAISTEMIIENESEWAWNGECILYVDPLLFPLSLELFVQQ